MKNKFKNMTNAHPDDKHQTFTVPAQPGFYALDRLCFQDGRVELQKIPVVGWIVKHYEADNFKWIEPLCFTPLSSLWNDELLSPDGVVFTRDGLTWDSFEEFESHATKRDFPTQNLAFDLLMKKAEEAFQS